MSQRKGEKTKRQTVAKLPGLARTETATPTPSSGPPHCRREAEPFTKSTARSGPAADRRGLGKPGAQDEAEEPCCEARKPGERRLPGAIQSDSAHAQVQVRAPYTYTFTATGYKLLKSTEC